MGFALWGSVPLQETSRMEVHVRLHLNVRGAFVLPCPPQRASRPFALVSARGSQIVRATPHARTFLWGFRVQWTVRVPRENVTLRRSSAHVRGMRIVLGDCNA